MRLSYDSTLKRAKRSKSCLSPAFLKRMVAFALSPSPSTFKTSPRPKRSCSINCPCCTRLADPPAEGDVLAVFAEGATRFRLRGTVGAIICCFGRTDTRSFPPYGASSLSGAKPLAFSLRKAAASSSTCGTSRILRQTQETYIYILQETAGTAKLHLAISETRLCIR